MDWKMWLALVVGTYIGANLGLVFFSILAASRETGADRYRPANTGTEERPYGVFD